MLRNDSGEVICKFLFLGDKNVGKSSLCRGISGQTESTESRRSNISVDYYSFRKTYDSDIIVKYFLIDSSSVNRNNPFTNKAMVKASDAVLFCYDVTDSTSFSTIKEYIKEMENESFLTRVNKILVGCKMDKEGRKVSYEEGEQLAMESGMSFIENSAKLNVNVDMTLNIIASITSIQALAFRKNVLKS